jgi:hypothetical protein
VDLRVPYAHATALPRWFLWSCPILRIHPILPAPSELPSRTSSPKCGASVNNGARGFTAHDGRVPGTANSAAGRAFGARWVGECIILSGSFGSIGCGGRISRPPVVETEKEPRLDATGPRFSWSGAGSGIHRKADGPGRNHRDATPKAGKPNRGPDGCQPLISSQLKSDRKEAPEAAHHPRSHLF